MIRWTTTFFGRYYGAATHLWQSGGYLALILTTILISWNTFIQLIFSRLFLAEYANINLNKNVSKTNHLIRNGTPTNVNLASSDKSSAQATVSFSMHTSL